MTAPFFLAKGKALVFEYGMDFVQSIRVCNEQEMEDATN